MFEVRARGEAEGGGLVCPVALPGDPGGGQCGQVGLCQLVLRILQYVKYQS